MNRYFYKAKDKSGKYVTGEVEASSREAAAKLVRQRGLVVLSVNTTGFSLFGFLTSFRNRITFGEVVAFTRQLSTMINAGLSISDSLNILREQSKGSMKKVISQIMADVEGGESLSASFSKHPRVFSSIYIALVKSGEVGGVLDKVTARLADDMEKQSEFRSRVKTALIYPAIIVSGMIIVAFVMMIFVIPRLVTLYQDFQADLPWPTVVLITISTFMSKFWPLIILAAVGAFYGFRAYRATSEGRFKTEFVQSASPVPLYNFGA